MSQKIYSILEDLSGEIGLYFKDMQTEEVLSINADNVFPAASTIKVPLVAYILKLIADKKIKFEDQIEIKDENRVGGTGIIRELDKSYIPTVRDHATLAIITSDNISTNELIDIAGGPEAVTEFCKDLGMTSTKLQRKMLDMEAIKAGKDNFTSPKDMGIILELIAKGELISEDLSLEILDIMKAQQHRSKLPALLPAVESYDPNVEYENVESGRVITANKTGDLWGVQNDIGIFVLPNNKRYILSVFTKDLESDAQGIIKIAELSKVIYDEMAKRYDK